MAEILKTIPINLDLKRVTAQASPIPTLVEGDTGNEFEITLTDGGVAVDLSEYTVQAVFSHPDGTISERTTEAIEKDPDDPNAVDPPPPIIIKGEEHNVVSFRLMDYNCYEGKNNCELVIRGETFVTSAQFNFDVRKGILSGGTPEQQEKLPTLMGLIDQVSLAVATAEGAVEKVSGVVKSETARAEAEAKRVEAEAIRAEADALREQKIDEVYTAYESGALKGEQGDKGDKGDTGAAGKDGKVQSVDNVEPNSNGTLTLSAVRYASQTLTTNQQEQARKNINAAPSSSYINAQDDGYSLTLSDAGKLILINSETDCTVSIPAAIDFPVGTEIEVAQMGAGVVNIFAFGADILSMDGMTSTAGQYAVVCLKKLDASTWLLGGALA